VEGIAGGKGGIRLCPVFFDVTGDDDMIQDTGGNRKSGPHKRRLAAALRALSVEVIDSDAPGQAYEEAAEGIENFTGRLKKHPRRVRHVGFFESSTGSSEREFNYGMMDLSPLSGAANPQAPPMKVDNRQEGRAVGTVRFPSSYGAGSGSVHNGYVVAVMDEVFAAVSSRMGGPVMTGILDVRFQTSIPVERELRVEGWVKRVAGEVIFTQASAHVEGNLAADADGVFFTVEEETYKRLSEERNARSRTG
jgi:acyl-coenzyme A thioesterase PaaI-like protein